MTSKINSIKKPKSVLIIFLGLLVIASLLRLYKIGEIPYGYNWDEVSIIYNAWSIAFWNRDEYATFLPLAFKSFDVYKAPLLIYILAIPYKLIGVSEILVRLISAFSGIMAVALTYPVALFLTKRKLTALIATALMAISPWAIQFSRAGFEANLALALGLGGFYFLFKGKERPFPYFLSAFLFALSLYAYHSAQLVIPLLLMIFGLLFYPQLKITKVKMALAGMMFLLLIIPLIHATLYQKAGTRSKELIMFDSSGERQTHAGVLSSFSNNVVNHMSLSFWINGQDSVGLRHGVPGYGGLYRAEFAFMILGLMVLVGRQKKEDLFILSWLVVGLMPSILSQNNPHYLRSLLTLPVPQIIAAIGIVFLVSQFHKRQARIKLGLIVTVFGLLILDVVGYLKLYYTSYAVNSATEYQYGYKQAIRISKQLSTDKELIYITDFYGQPYIFTLLYNQYTPDKYLWGALANYRLGAINWKQREPNSVYVGTPQEISPDDPLVTEIITIPGTTIPVFIIAKT